MFTWAFVSQKSPLPSKIPAYTPELRNYLKGRNTLNLPSFRKIMRNHYKELDSSPFFNLLSNAKQGNNKTMNYFAIRLENLHQKLV